MNPAENYMLKQSEPFRSILLQLQILIEASKPDLDLKYKWGIPYYYDGKKPFCFLNVSKGYVDVGFRFNDNLKEFNAYIIQEKRIVMKSLRYFSLEDIDGHILEEVLNRINT